MPQTLLREEEVELPVVRSGRAGDEVVRAGDVRALVAELAATHDLLQALGNLLQRYQPREVHLVVPNRDRLELTAALVRLHEPGGAPVCLPVRAGDVEVAPRLRDARVDGVLEQVVAHDDVRSGAERGRREPDRQREGDREAAAEPSRR